MLFEIDVVLNGMNLYFMSFIPHHLRRELVQAVCVAERAFALKTRAAIQIQGGNFGLFAQGRRVVGAGRAVYRHQIAPQSGSNVHEAAVVANHGIGAGQQIYRFSQIGFAA